MKKMIVLKIEWFDASALKAAQVERKKKEVFEESIKEFRCQMVELIKSIKIIKEDQDRSEILIQFDDKLWEELYEALVAAAIVECIDSMVPEDQ